MDYSTGLLVAKSNYDDSLAIYRFSPDRPDHDTRLLNISGTIIPPNGTFVVLETISYTDQIDLDPALLENIFCLSEFEYRSQESDIFFNVVQVVPVSTISELDGKFCEIRSSLSNSSFCNAYYYASSLYYAALDPSFGTIQPFEDECVAVKYLFGYTAGPKADLSIDIARHIDRSGFPTNNEKLVVFYPNISGSFYIPFSDIPDYPAGLTKILPIGNATNRCMVKYSYWYKKSAVLYNYIGYNIDEQGRCSCGDASCALANPGPIVYGYLTENSRVVPYTKCSSLPYDRIVPQLYPDLFVICPCILI